MEFVAKLMSTGMIRIPKNVRDAFQIKDGVFLVLDLKEVRDGNKITTTAIGQEKNIR